MFVDVRMLLLLFFRFCLPRSPIISLLTATSHHHPLIFFPIFPHLRALPHYYHHLYHHHHDHQLLDCRDDDRVILSSVASNGRRWTEDVVRAAHAMLSHRFSLAAVRVPALFSLLILSPLSILFYTFLDTTITSSQLLNVHLLLLLVCAPLTSMANSWP